MPCLEPNKDLSKEARQILLSLGKLKSADKLKLEKETGFVSSLIVRKLRELAEKEAIKEDGRVYSLTDKGEEAFSVLNE